MCSFAADRGKLLETTQQKLTMSPSSQSHADSNVWLPRDICFVILRRSLNEVINAAGAVGDPSSSCRSAPPSRSDGCERPLPSSRAFITFFFVSCCIFHA